MEGKKDERKEKKEWGKRGGREEGRKEDGEKGKQEWFSVQFVRTHPIIKLNKKLKLSQWLFFRLENFCDAPVGLQSGRIRNNQITASSQYNKYHAPWLARLHRARRGSYTGSWAARYNKHNQWLQIDFRKSMKVTGIATQGRQDADQWVTAYYIYYSSDGVYFSMVKHWWSPVKVRNSSTTLLLRNKLKLSPQITTYPHLAKAASQHGG